MIWKRVILSWLTLLALMCASAGATASVDVSPKPHVGGLDLVVATCIEVSGVASAEEHLGKRCLLMAATSDVPNATRGAPKLLGQPITWKAKDLARVISKHGASLSGKGGALKSRFNAGEDIAGLIRSATHQQARAQAGSKNLIRTFDAGRNIGTDVATGLPTSIMNVVTQPGGRLVTAFPGVP